MSCRKQSACLNPSYRPCQASALQRNMPLADLPALHNSPNPASAAGYMTPCNMSLDYRCDTLPFNLMPAPYRSAATCHRPSCSTTRCNTSTEVLTSPCVVSKAARLYKIVGDDYTTDFTMFVCPCRARPGEGLEPLSCVGLVRSKNLRDVRLLEASFTRSWLPSQSTTPVTALY